MGILSRKDYLLVIISKLRKIIAFILKRQDVLTEEEAIYSVNEGLELLGLSIEKVQQGKMNEIIAEQPRKEILFLLLELLTAYLKHTKDPLIEKQKEILSSHLKDTKADCLFTDFY